MRINKEEMILTIEERLQVVDEYTIEQIYDFLLGETDG